ncbi:quinone oxidoreductase family protein [Williamsia muralis]|uniref:NADP-dependent oxidoreductase n=1 Tax=Williamsia marianensis TaxID=85044 RepID=A0ABU4EYS0_WILMA|nr:NADP-dependent oxidoreductase [Williamsia muralis]MDV7136396.1 NADP-dependent oxidoreductase [Williamsia muralis]
MAKAVVASAYGGPEVLQVKDLDLGNPGPGEVLIDVKAAGVNPVDLKLYSGAFGTDPSKLPLHLGMEVSGVIAAVGPDAEGISGPLSVGDEVIAFRVKGGYAEQVLTSASNVVTKPATTSFEQAAGLMLVGATAVHLLETVHPVAGETLLIHGGAGGVGLSAVQLAVQRGSTVIATASHRRHGVLTESGAVPLLYGSGLADRVRSLAPEGVDAAIDTVGTDEAISVSLELVSDQSRIATIAGFGKTDGTGIRLLGNGPGADPGTAIRDAARVDLARLAGDGSLRVEIDRTYPLDHAADAHRYVQDGHAAGKVVLLP